MLEESFVIRSSETELLRGRIDEINSMFDVKVEVQANKNGGSSDRIKWVVVKGTNKKNVSDAKTHILALCSPELKEHISFPGFPIIIFPAFQERIKRKIQRECGVIILMTDDGFLDIHGSNIGVTMAISKIHHLHKLNKDRDPNKEKEAAMDFDLYIHAMNDEYQDELQTLSNCLKKELLHIINLPQRSVISSRKVTEPTEAETIPKQVESEVISIDDSQDSFIVISSSDDDQEGSDDSQDEKELKDEKKLEGDGMDGDLSYVLPPNFVIREWIKVHYEGTSSPTDYVNKTDMLNHFKTHFDVPDHPDLANTFFDKLAVRIFPQDPNYRSVKTKKTKSKQSRRRLICLRRRTVSDGDKVDITPSSSSTLVRDTASPPRPVLSKPMQPGQIPQASQSSVMKEWNANRTGLKNIPTNAIQPVQQRPQLPPPTNAIHPVQQRPQLSPPTNTIHPAQQRPQLLPPQPIPVRRMSPPPPYHSRYSAPPAQYAPSQPVHDLQGWLNTAPRRTRPRMEFQRQDSTFNSLAKRVSTMSNEALICKGRPQANDNLRPIVIDGSNVAMAHGNGNKFSCRGIAICARFFMERGHKHVTCFVPNYRKGGGGDPPSDDAYLLIELEKLNIVKATPSRRIGRENIVCYDDRFIVELAAATNGIILSNDQYRDLMIENRRFKSVVEQQLLQYAIVGDLLMLPEDPLGRNGPSLEEYLTLPPNGRKTTPKVVKVPAPLRPRQATPTRTPMPIRPPASTTVPIERMPLAPATHPPPLQHAPVTSAWGPLNKTPHNVILSPDQNRLAYEMIQVFPDRQGDVYKVITEHPLITDITHLINLILISDTGT